MLLFALVGCTDSFLWWDFDDESGEDPKGPGGSAEDPTLPKMTCGPGIAAYADGAPYADAQEAVETLDGRTDVSTVSFCPGIHDVRIRSVFEDAVNLESVSGDPSDTELTGNNQHHILEVVGADHTRVRLRGLTFSDAEGMEGAAVEAQNIDSMVVEDCVFRNNRAGSGGAISVFLDRDGEEVWPIQILGSVFENNVADSRGGSLLLRALEANQMLISNSTFRDNEVLTGGGGAIYSSPIKDGSHIEIEDSTFENNIADTRGGALELEYLGSLAVVNTSFVGNSSSDGGAIYLEAWPNPQGHAEISASTFHRNTSEAPFSGAVDSYHWSVAFDAVDFGEGADTNTPRDIADCDEDLLSDATLTYDPDRAPPCQQ